MDDDGVCPFRRRVGLVLRTKNNMAAASEEECEKQKDSDENYIV